MKDLDTISDSMFIQSLEKLLTKAVDLHKIILAEDWEAMIITAGLCTNLTMNTYPLNKYMVDVLELIATKLRSIPPYTDGRFKGYIVPASLNLIDKERHVMRNAYKGATNLYTGEYGANRLHLLESYISYLEKTIADKLGQTIDE